MPRSLILAALGWWAVCGLPALDFGTPATAPTWTLSPSAGPVFPGQPFEVTVRVALPSGYYQDTASDFLSFEPLPPAVVVKRSSSTPALRNGKSSFTGTFTLHRTVVLPAATVQGPLVLGWKTSWQICQVDGVCLLPAEGRLSQSLTVGTQASPGLDFWGALLGAFLGGILLNLMPCVFPVLALKALGLASAAGRPLGERRREALAFAAGGFGVLLGLGLATASLLAAGQSLEWGFSFQQPAFVWVLVLVFWSFTLQLWGLWSWQGSPFSLTTTVKPGPARSFAGGAFLVVAAIPCTAPLLGPALGFAFTQPPALIPLFFISIGLGLVAPLLILQGIPAWGRFLPKPGRWMVAVERILGFFLAATVVYLLWILTQQTAPDRIWSALGLLGLLAAAFAWTGRKSTSWIGKRLPRALLAALIFVSFFIVLAPSSPEADRPDKRGWKSFSQGELQMELSTGKTVFVDATAAWCATCQVNELAVLDRPDVQSLFDRLGIVRLRADYTRPNQEIRAWLASVGRAGLPVYALYRPGQPPYLFPELLTDGNFTKVLAKGE